MNAKRQPETRRYTSQSNDNRMEINAIINWSATIILDIRSVRKKKEEIINK